MQSLDYIIHRLGKKQVPYRPAHTPQVDLEPYPIDFEYLGRSLHRFPQISKDFKIVNLETPTLQHSILFAIYGGNPNVKQIKALKLPHAERTERTKKPRATALNKITPEQLCQYLNINLLILGPDEEHIRQYLHKDNANQNFALVYHDYYNNFYPIISLEKQEVFLFDENDSSIQELRQLAESST